MSLLEGAGSDSEIPLYANPSHQPWGNATTSTQTFNGGSGGGGVDFGVHVVNPSLDHANPNNGTTILYTPHGAEDKNWIVVGVLVALIVMLWIILGGMLCYPMIRFIRRKWPVSKRRIQRRYETIEGWLITKVVRPHDESCDQIQKGCPPKVEDTPSPKTDAPLPKPETSPGIETDPPPPNPDSSGGSNPSQSKESCSEIKHRESYDTADTALDEEESLVDGSNNRDCPICMEHFAVGDIVSWSSYERCSHVYHHRCIKEWLLSHNNCPFCREVFLPVDRARGKITKELFHELNSIRSQRAEKTYFCVQDGLVTIEQGKVIAVPSSSNSSSKKTAPSLRRKCGHVPIKDTSTTPSLREKLKPGVTKADLRKLRGDRAEKICYGDTAPQAINVIQPHDLDDEEDLESQPHDNNSDSTPSELLEPTNDSLTTSYSSDEEEDENDVEEGKQRHDKVEEGQYELSVDLCGDAEDGIEAGLVNGCGGSDNLSCHDDLTDGLDVEASCSSIELDPDDKTIQEGEDGTGVEASIRSPSRCEI